MVLGTSGEGPMGPKGVKTQRVRNDALETMLATSRAICYLSSLHTTHVNIWEAEAGELQTQSHSGLHCKHQPSLGSKGRDSGEFPQRQPSYSF